MSRHRNIRNLDYEELLDDEAAEDEISPEDNQRWDQAVSTITNRLGTGFKISDIREAAWHYYFDVDKATDYLLKKKAPVQPKPKAAPASASNQPSSSS